MEPQTWSQLVPSWCHNGIWKVLQYVDTLEVLLQGLCRGIREILKALSVRKSFCAVLWSTACMEGVSKLHGEQERKSLPKSSEETPDVTGREIKEIHAFRAGLKSLRNVAGLSLFNNLEILSLHDNDIDCIEGLETLLSLRELNLSSNKIKEMEGLSSLSELQVLNLSCNQIEEIKDLQGLRALKKLVLSHNHIKSLHGLCSLSGTRYSLRILDLRDNRVDSLSEVRVLAGCMYLKELSFAQGAHTNPICNSPAYKSSVIAATPHLYKLDGELLSGTLPGEFQTPRHFGDTSQSYLDASVPSWVLQYASLCQSDPRYQDGESRDSPHNISNECQPEKVPFVSQPQVSGLSSLLHVESTRHDDSGLKPCPPNPDPIGISEGQFLRKAQHSTYSSSRQGIAWNPSSGSKSVGTYQAEEASNVQHGYIQTLDRAGQPSSTPYNRVPCPSHDGSQGNSESSEQEVSRVDEEPEVQNLSSNTRPQLPVIDHSLNGFYRRRWPNTKSAPPPARRKRVNFFEEVSDDALRVVLETRILDLVHELALAKGGAKGGLQPLQATSGSMTDEEVSQSLRNDDCERSSTRSTRKSKESCFNCREEKKHSSSGNTSDNKELNSDSKIRRRVRWSSENWGRTTSGEIMKRWVILVGKWISRMKPDGNSKSEGEGSEIQKVLQLLNEEVKHLHHALGTLNSVPKVGETQTLSAEPAESVDKSEDDEKDTGDSKYLAKCKALEDQLAETKHRVHDEKEELYKILDAKQQTVVELEKVLKEKNEKLQELLEQTKLNFSSQSKDPAVCPEDHIRETIISAKAEVLSMEKSLQKSTVAAQSAKAALLNATTDKENSKKLVISMYKAFEEERANLKLCKSQLETCQSQCLEIMKEHKNSNAELERMFEEKQKELVLVKMLHKQEVESIRALGVELGKSQGIAMAEESSAQLRHTLRQELSDKQNELNEARKENEKVRQDTAFLQSEHLKEVAELKEVIQSLHSKGKENRRLGMIPFKKQHGLVQVDPLLDQNNAELIVELSNVVRSQKAQLQLVNFDVENSAIAEKELQKKEHEINSLKLKASMCDELSQEVERLRHKLSEVSQDTNVKADDEKKLILKLISLQQENAELAASSKRLEASEDVVKIKNKMLESQNEQIKDLKEKLLESREGFNRVLRTSETLESEWIKRLQNEAEKGEGLRRELKSQSLAVDVLDQKLKVERVAKLAAEKTSKLLQQKVEEKEEMLRYVEDEISQVKTLYDDKLRAIAVERDQAMEELEKKLKVEIVYENKLKAIAVERDHAMKELEKTLQETEQTKKELLEEGKRRRELSVELQKSRELLEASSSQQKQMEALKATISEKDFRLKDSELRVLELESQLNCQTLAIEKQRAVASSKVEQLRRVLEDLGDLK